MNMGDIFTEGVEVLNDQTFDASGTWTKPTGIQPGDLAVIDAWGGGGGGSMEGGTTEAAVGGYGGEFTRRVLLVSALGSTEAIAVGAGGIGGAPIASGSTNPGTNGGGSSVAGITAAGGLGGSRGNLAGSLSRGAVRSFVALYTPGDGGNAPGTANTGAKNPGQSIYGGGGGGVVLGSNRQGQPGKVPGGGGGGSNGGATSGFKGGDGAPGRVRIRILRGISQWEISEIPA